MYRVCQTQYTKKHKICRLAGLHVFMAIKTHNPWCSYIMVSRTSISKLELPRANRQMTAQFTLQTAMDRRTRRSKFKAHCCDNIACSNCVVTRLTSTNIVRTAVVHIQVEMQPEYQTLFLQMFKKCFFFSLRN